MHLVVDINFNVILTEGAWGLLNATCELEIIKVNKSKNILKRAVLLMKQILWK